MPLAWPLYAKRVGGCNVKWACWPVFHSGGNTRVTGTSVDDRYRHKGSSRRVGGVWRVDGLAWVVGCRRWGSKRQSVIPLWVVFLSWEMKPGWERESWTVSLKLYSLLREKSRLIRFVLVPRKFATTRLFIECPSFFRSLKGWPGAPAGSSC